MNVLQEDTRIEGGAAALAAVKKPRIFKKRYGLLLLLVAFIAYSYTWTYTPYGRLDWRAAFTLRTLTFTVPIEHGKVRKQKIPMTINSLFVLSYLLPNEDVRQTRDIQIPGPQSKVPARIYWPEGNTHSSGALPVIVYYHGGGFVSGSVDLFDQLARSLANSAKSIVVSVDYRLAPDHPWPAGIDDAYAAAAWASDNAASLGGDPARMIVAGDSAGGNLAAVVALKARDQQGPPIAGQLLYYPVTDLTDTPYASKKKFQDGYGLSSESGAAFHNAYIGELSEAQRANPYVSPLKAQSLADLPPTFLVIGGFDPLADSVDAYAARLIASGVKVEHIKYGDIIHGFMSVPLLPQRREALNATGAWVTRQRPAGPGPGPVRQRHQATNADRLRHSQSG